MSCPLSCFSGLSGTCSPVPVCFPDLCKKIFRCVSVQIFLSRFFQLSGFCPDKRCSLSICPARKGRDRAVRTFGVLVRLRPYPVQMWSVPKNGLVMFVCEGFRFEFSKGTGKCNNDKLRVEYNVVTCNISCCIYFENHRIHSRYWTSIE